MLIKHPSRIASPAEWPDLWPFQMNGASRQARDTLDFWLPFNPNAPLANLSPHIDPPTATSLGDFDAAANTYSYASWHTPLLTSGRNDFATSLWFCCSIWAFIPQSVADGSLVLWMWALPYGLPYSSPNFYVYSNGSVASVIHHAYDAVASPAGVLRFGAWNHFAMAFFQGDGGSYYGQGIHKLYVNGRLVGQRNDCIMYYVSNLATGLRGYFNARDFRFKQSYGGSAGITAVNPNWSDDEILEQYENPFDLYDRFGRRLYFSVSDFECPTSVVSISGAWKVA